MPANRTDPDPSAPESRPAWRVLRTGMLIAGSAVAGGLAVVFWNRKSLSALRQPGRDISRPRIEPDEDTE